MIIWMIKLLNVFVLLVLIAPRDKYNNYFHYLTILQQWSI